MTIARNNLGAADPHEDVVLRHLISSAVRSLRDVDASAGGVMRISRSSGLRPYEVLIAPLAEGTLNLGFGFPAETVAVFLRDPETRGVLPIDWLRRLHALTAAEARLMQALIVGETLESIAHRLLVQKETLRTQLKSVFLKTGASSQAELIRIGLRGLSAFQK